MPGASAMMAADEQHRYEISPEGVLSVLPPASYAHAIIATRLTGWLAAAGVPADRIAQAVGLRMVVEIVSPGSEGIDTVTKRKEYAAAGIPQYWMIDQDPPQTVTLHQLDDDQYAVQAAMPLAWLLNTSPVEHGLA